MAMSTKSSISMGPGAAMSSAADKINPPKESDATFMRMYDVRKVLNSVLETAVAVRPSEAPIDDVDDMPEFDMPLDQDFSDTISLNTDGTEFDPQAAPSSLSTASRMDGAGELSAVDAALLMGKTKSMPGPATPYMATVDSLIFGRRRTEPAGSSDAQPKREGPMLQGDYPSIGSALHATGQCKPCAWFHKKAGCLHDKQCLHCHICPPSEMKDRRKMKAEAFKTGSLQPKIRAGAKFAL